MKRNRPTAGCLGALIGAAVLAGPVSGPAESRDPVDVLTSLLSLVSRRGVEVDGKALNTELARAVVRAADPGGAVLTPDAYARLRERRSGFRRSAGIRMEWEEEAELKVTAVLEGSPAERAGLVPGALLDSVAGRFVAGRSVPEVLRWLDGGDADTVRVDARLPGESEVRAFEIERTKLPSLSITVAESWPRGLAYLKVSGLHDDAAPTVAARLRRWQEEGRFGVMLDLRGAGGERVDAAAALAGLLSERPESATLQIESLDGATVEEFMAVAGERIHLPTMVLIDGETEGSSELLVGVLRAVGRGAMLIGAPTAGDCGLREAIAFNDQTRLYLRTRRVLLDGKDVCAGAGQGFAPHILVDEGAAPSELSAKDPVRDRGIRRGKDEEENQALRDRVQHDKVLQRAVDVLLGLQALDFNAAVEADATQP